MHILCSRHWGSGKSDWFSAKSESPNSIWNARTRLNKFIRIPKYFVGKRFTITITKAWDNSPDRALYLEQKRCLVASSFLGFSTLVPMQEAFPCAFTFLKITLPILFSYIRTFDKCMSRVFKDYLFFERRLETQTNKQSRRNGRCLSSVLRLFYLILRRLCIYVSIVILHIFI